MNPSSRLMSAGAAPRLALGFALAGLAAAPAQAAYWNLFNFEGESDLASVYVTYDTLADMLNDTNRTVNFNPGGAADNVVGTGSDGTTYWSVFNVEGESALSAVIVTYATLTDMLNDTNRTGGFNPGGAANNVVGSGADIRGALPIPEPDAASVLAAALAALAAVRPRRTRPMRLAPG